MHIVKWTYGDRLRKIRRTMGLSSRDFAAALGVTNSSLAQWETDRSLPRDPDALADLVQEVTGIPAAWLLNGCCPLGGVPVPDGSAAADCLGHLPAVYIEQVS